MIAPFTLDEIDQKRGLYLECGAHEFWTCDLKGQMRFFDSSGELEASNLAPKCPKRVTLDVD